MLEKRDLIILIHVDEAELFKFILNGYCARNTLVSKEANLGRVT